MGLQGIDKLKFEASLGVKQRSRRRGIRRRLFVSLLNFPWLRKPDAGQAGYIALAILIPANGNHGAVPF